MCTLPFQAARCSLTGREKELEHMLAATADDWMRESEISEHARVSASEVGFGSTVARLSKESGCAIAREAWEGMEHLIHHRRRGAAHRFSSLAPTFGTPPGRTFAPIEVPFETLHQGHRRRCRVSGPDGRHGRTAPQSVPKDEDTEKCPFHTGY